MNGEETFSISKDYKPMKFLMWVLEMWHNVELLVLASI